MSLCGQDLSLEKLAWDQNSAQGGQVLWLKSCLNHHPSTAMLILNPSPDTSLCFAQFYLMVNLLGCPSPCHSLSTHLNEPDQQIAKKVITLAND